jgi:NADP-dependent 3-hydroxy acid dehydrogenase YdfG
MTRQLIAGGHQVFAITRRQDKVEALHKAGPGPCL